MTSTTGPAVPDDITAQTVTAIERPRPSPMSCGSTVVEAFLVRVASTVQLTMQPTLWTWSCEAKASRDPPSGFADNAYYVT